MNYSPKVGRGHLSDLLERHNSQMHSLLPQRCVNGLIKLGTEREKLQTWSHYSAKLWPRPHLSLLVIDRMDFYFILLSYFLEGHFEFDAFIGCCI